jgi:hypothetical protein
MDIEPGIYEHFKGGRYRVLHTASHTETHEGIVIYMSLDSHGTIWARPLSMWNEQVEWPDGFKRPRFIPVKPVLYSISSSLADPT